MKLLEHLELNAGCVSAGLPFPFFFLLFSRDQVSAGRQHGSSSRGWLPPTRGFHWLSLTPEFLLETLAANDVFLYASALLELTVT